MQLKEDGAESGAELDPSHTPNPQAETPVQVIATPTVPEQAMPIAVPDTSVEEEGGTEETAATEPETEAAEVKGQSQEEQQDQADS